MCCNLCKKKNRAPRRAVCAKRQDVINTSLDTCFVTNAGELQPMSPNTCVGKKKNGARRRSVLTAGQFVQEGRGQDVINHPSGQEERQVILCAGHIQLEIIHTVQQALEALLHLIRLDDLVVQAGQQVCCHLVLPAGTIQISPFLV